MKRILTCTDGEEHTVRAEEHGVSLAECFAASVTGLYVQSTLLHKFTHEIYAVGRNECREHLDSSFHSEGMEALDALEGRCTARGVSFEPRMRRGDVAEEIVREASEGAHDIVIMGAKLLTGWRDRLESVNVALDVFKRTPVSVLFVR